MKENNPRRYKVAGLGGWGIIEGLIYEKWKEQDFNINEISKKEGVKSVFGLDFGLILAPLRRNTYRKFGEPALAGCAVIYTVLTVKI